METIGQAKTIKRGVEEFWRAHFEAAEKFSGTDRQYCKEHGLNPKRFSAFKTKFGFSRVRRRKRSIKRPAFVEVRPKVEQAAQSSFPEARWLAEFALILMRQTK